MPVRSEVKSFRFSGFGFKPSESRVEITSFSEIGLRSDTVSGASVDDMVLCDTLRFEYVCREAVTSPGLNAACNQRIS